MEAQQAQRRQDKKASRQRTLVAFRAARNDSSNGSVSVTINVTQAGNMSVKVTQTLLQCIESSPQQHEVRQCLADLALQVCDLVRARSDAAEARQEVPSNSSEQPSTAPVSQPTAELKQLDDQLLADS